MCGRYTFEATIEDLSDRFDIAEKPPKFRSYNVAPAMHIPVINRNSPNKVTLMRWGFIPSWADPNKVKIKPINARDDKVTGGFYRAALSHTRCIIPASAFYEWKRYTMDGKEEKQPYYIHLKKEKLFGFAGLYSELKDAEGKPVYTCCIITTEPNSLMKDIHNRMPVILHQEDEDTWLTEDTSQDTLLSMLRPYPASAMEVYRVSKDVNNTRNDNGDLIKPINSA